ncbi:DUF1552 domain-containing protein [Paludisphaera rhizosphaerae]|uniref:DUF1552 domain-containing protein n=1 Tax=Paludisphaera rhizosphaerae TaxID=2711216 RepID=UPI0013E9F71F|nr:DUF1552 domain-containing protein [Paludisphaera rhizosphaerae]
MSRAKISRRTLLRGVGAAIALPWMESMAVAAAPAAKGPAGPRRMAFFYVPNGVHMQDWKPGAEGRDFQIPWILEPLAPLKQDMLVLTGLAQDNARAKGDGPGDHARSLSCFLTGVHPVKTDGANIQVGVSVDQVAAQKLGSATRLPSLELGIERGGQSGNCDSGYSCAYSSNISWRSPTTPSSKEINPRLVFDRLFGNRNLTGSEADRKKRSLYERSILDFVLEDAEALKRRIGQNDRRKMDEYLTAVREIEQRIARADLDDERPTDLNVARPAGVPKDYAEHVRLMFDLMVLAFQTDTTRICTFMYGNEGSTRPYPFLDIPEGHHDLSHHANDPKKHEKIRKINRFHIEEFARMLKKLKESKEGEASILDNSMIVYGSGISDGNRHNHDDLPVLVMGRGGGTIDSGRHVVHKPQPLNNLFLSMLDRMDVPCERLGDSTGRLDKLS